MKTKISLLFGVLGVGLIACAQLAHAQGYGANNKPTGTSNASSSAGGAKADPSKAKPGTRLAGGVIVGTPITMDDAKKKYPPPGSGKYPTGDRPYSHTPGHVLSPYPPHQEFECSSINKGDLVLDTTVNKVFVRP